MEQQILNYPNHLIDNGILYRGTTTKRVVKPNSEGVYKIRYKNEEYAYTMDELLMSRAPRREPQKKEPKKVKECSTIKDLVASYGIVTSTYYKWLDRNYEGDRVKFTREKHVEMLDKRKECIEEAKGKMVKEICKKYDVKYKGYSSNIKTIGLVYAKLSKHDHEREVKAFRDRLFRKPQDSIPRTCRALGVDYDCYRGYLKSIGITYGSLTKEGHDIQLEVYAKKVGKLK